jgi:hypothetical protein
MFWSKIVTIKFIKSALNVNINNKLVKLTDLKHERAVPINTIWVKAKNTRACKNKSRD